MQLLHPRPQKSRKREEDDMTNRNTCNTAKYSEAFDQFVRFVEQEQLLRTDLWERFVRQFKMDADQDGGWRGEYWGKMMRGGCLVYAYSQNP